MRKSIGITLTIIVGCIAWLVFPAMSFFGFDVANAESYQSFYNTKNAPMFYGATKISLSKNAVESFDVSDSRFRVFAKDFEDGDLTHKIVCESCNVLPNTVGEYEIKYSVFDSHNNKSSLTVPVSVLNNEDGTFLVERTVYAIPAMGNMKSIGTERCNTGDRQILGVFLPADQTAEIKVLDAGQDLQITYFTNTRAQNSFQTIKCNNSDWQTLKNVNNSVSYDSVPLITSPRLNEEKIDVCFKIELKYNSSAKQLNYFHFNDNEEKFKADWKISENSFGVVDGEALLCIVPFADVDKLSNYTASGYNNPFASIDDFLNYYKQVVDRMDKMLGLEFDSDTALNQNYRTKYTVVADGAMSSVGAYYAGGFIGVGAYTIAPVFQYGWGTLHEIAHGYQGYLGRGVAGGTSIYLNETGNNVLAHYIQVSGLYKKQDRYLGALKTSEQNINAKRKTVISNGNTIFNNNDGTYTNTTEKLYCIVNMLDAFESEKTLGKLFSYFRKLVNDYGVNKFTVPDVYAKFFAEEYNANIIPYLKAWALDISNDVEAEIFDMQIPAYSILSDSLTEQTKDEIKLKENITLNYGLVSDEILEKHNVKSNLTFTIEIDDFEKIKGKQLALFKNGEMVRVEKIENTTFNFQNLSTGSYQIKLPIVFEKTCSVCSVSLKEGDNTAKYSYKNFTVKDYTKHPTAIKIKGIYNTFGFTLTFSNDYSSAQLVLGGASLGNRNATWENKPDDVYMSVKLLDEANNTIENVVVKGNQYFTDQTLTNANPEIKVGYTVEIYSERPQAVQVYSVNTNKVISQYTSTSKNISYLVTEHGLKLVTDEDFDEQTILYDADKQEMLEILNEYKNTVTQNELENKRKNVAKKNEIIGIFNQLKPADKQDYENLIEKIKKGGSPIISPISNPVKIKENTQINLLDLISISDNEDFEIDKQNTEIVTNLDITTVGTYIATYTVKDSDNNQTKKTIYIQVSPAETSPNENPTTPPTEEEDNTLAIIMLCGGLIGAFASLLGWGIGRLIKKNKKGL